MDYSYYGIKDFVEVIENMNSAAVLEAVEKVNGPSFERFMEILEELKGE